MWRILGVLVLVGGVCGCGVPRGVGAVAGREEVLLTSVQSDGEVREALLKQAGAWETLSSLMVRHDFGGVAVGSDFVGMVEQAAALARRQKTLIETGADDPVANRRVLEGMRKMWGDVKRYMGE